MALGIKCYGKVQGVFFRATAKTTADNLNLRGWIQNEGDGTVRIHAEGESEAMDKFLSWCERDLSLRWSGRSKHGLNPTKIWHLLRSEEAKRFSKSDFYQSLIQNALRSFFEGCRKGICD